MGTWVYDPHSGGVNIPPAVRARTEYRIRNYAETQYPGRFARLDIRFRGALCYIDAFTEPPEPTPEMLRATGQSRDQFLEGLRTVPLHLCRLRYFGNQEARSMAFYTYSNERYEPCVYDTGSKTAPPRRRSRPGRSICEMSEVALMDEPQEQYIRKRTT